MGDGSSKDAPENFIKPSIHSRIVPLEKTSAFSMSEDNAAIRIQKSLRGVSTGYSGQSFSEGDILILPPAPVAPLGAIRKIVYVKDTPGEVFVSTAPATLTEAIDEARVETTISLDKLPSDAGAELQDGVSVSQDFFSLNNGTRFTGISFNISDFILSDIDGNRRTHDDQLKLSAALSTQKNAKIVLRISGGQLDEFSFSMKGHEFSRFALSGFLNVPLSQNWPLFKARYSPLVLTIGGFPLVFTPSLAVELTAQATPTGDVAIVGERESSFESGLGYANSEFNRVREYEHSGSALPPFAQIPKGKVQAGFRVKAELSLYETLSAFASIKFALGSDFHLREKDCYLNRAIGDNSLGVQLQLLSIKLGAFQEKWNWLDKELGRGSCLPNEVPGGDPRTFAWRYQQSTSSSSAANDNALEMDFAAQGGLAMILPRENSTPFYRMSSNGAVQVARREQVLNHMGRLVKSLNDGGHLLIGDTSDSLILERSDISGRTLWSWEFRMPGDPQVVAVDFGQASDAIYIAGVLHNPGAGQPGVVFVSRFSADGEHQWTRKYSADAAVAEVNVLRLMPNGRLMIGGQVSELAGSGLPASQSNSGKYAWVTMLEANGQPVFSKRIAAGSVVAISAPAKANSGFGILGYREEKAGEGIVHKPWLLGMNQDGGLSMVTGLDATAHPNSLSQTPEGFLLAGTWNNQNHETHAHDDGWLCEIDFQGNVLWSRKIYSSKPDGLKIAAQIPGDRLLIGGYEESGLQVHPIVLNLPLNGSAEFLPASGFSQISTITGRVPFTPLDTFHPVSASETSEVVRVARPLQFSEIEDVVVYRIGRY